MSLLEASPAQLRAIADWLENSHNFQLLVDVGIAPIILFADIGMSKLIGFEATEIVEPSPTKGHP